MHEAGGIEEIKKAIEKLSKRHSHHLKFYDANNDLDKKRRLTGTVYSMWFVDGQLKLYYTSTYTRRVLSSFKR